MSGREEEHIDAAPSTCSRGAAANEKHLRGLSRWKRFSLRSLFVLTTFCCLALGVWTVYVSPYRNQQQSLAMVRRLGGDATYASADGPGWQRWLVTTLLGPDAFVNVTAADLSGRKVDDDSLRALGGLKSIERLSLDHTAVTDEGLAILSSMPLLKELSLRYTKIGDRGASYLSALEELHTLHLTGDRVTDAAIGDLIKMPGLQQLYIRWTSLTEAGVARLSSAMPRCAVYYHQLALR